jgi:dihydrodipicolinate synthase/N-acetylneuraminate lyase
MTLRKRLLPLVGMRQMFQLPAASPGTQQRIVVVGLGRRDEARRLYEWFLPLLRLDVVPKFVQLIKLVQAELGQGSARVRPPRLELAGQEREEALRLIRQRLAQRPSLG